MYNLNEAEVKGAVTNAVYQRGLDMYLRNKIKRVDAKIESNQFYEKLVVSSLVESAYDIRNYDTSFEIRKDDNMIKCKCSCPAGKEGSICKHSIALLIKWCRQGDSILKNSNINIPIGLNSISSIYNEDNLQQRELNLSLYCNAHIDSRAGYEEFYFKIGEEKLYIIKDIRAFINSVHEKRSLEFGKFFTYDSKIHKFSQKDMDIIDFILLLEEMGDEDDYYYRRSNKFFSGKTLKISDRLIRRFLEIIEPKKINFTFQGEDYGLVDIINGDMDLSISIAQNEEKNVTLEFQEEYPRALNRNNNCFFYKGKIYLPSKEQIQIFTPLYEEMEKKRRNFEDKALIFPKSELSSVISYARNAGGRAYKNVNISEDIEAAVINEPLNSSFYLDKEEENVVLKLKLLYGDFDILNTSESNAKVIIRDENSERKVYETLFQLGFAKKENRYELKNQDKIYEFLAEGVPKLQNLGDVFYSEAFKTLRIKSPKITSGVRINEEDLLEFSFKIEDVDNKELSSILKSIRENKKYHKLKNGSFIPIENSSIKAMESMLSYLDVEDKKLENGSFALSKYEAMYLNNKLSKDEFSYVNRSRDFDELIENLNNYKNKELKATEEIWSIMRDYQKFGFKWLSTLGSLGFGGILADEMGLGKTLQAIAYISSLKAEESKFSCLVVAPTSLVYNWGAEIEKFAKDLSYKIIIGSKAERLNIIKESQSTDIIITSYPLLRRDIETLKDMKFSLCILDEAQQIKNPLSQNAQCAKSLSAKKKFVLTGTPFENNLTELWSVFDFIMPGYLKSHTKFVSLYESPIIKDSKAEAIKELSCRINPFILRRLKKDVVLELPPKIEHKLLVDMTKEQKKLYAAYANSAKEEVQKEIQASGFSKSKIKILALLTRLRQICCDPSVFYVDYKGESGKIEALLDLLSESISEGHRVLIFSQFTRVLKNIRYKIEKSGISCFYLDGETKTILRGQMVNDFNEGSAEVFLISLKAGGTGLNLTGADLVIHFDPWWNPAVEEQATDRAHRIGQTKTVEVIKLIARGTIEEKIEKIKERKKAIINEVLENNEGEERLISSFTEDEIKELFE